MKPLSHDERAELESLRAYRAEHEGKALSKAFARLESLIESAHDPIISIRAFRVIGDCLLALKEEMER